MKAGSGAAIAALAGQSVSAGSETAASGVSDVLDTLVSQKGGALKWRTSVIDLMKALDLDDRLQARRKLADKWGYVATSGSAAAMNIWLHKEILAHLRRTNGALPVNLTARHS
jgi:hypothetical protein